MEKKNRNTLLTAGAAVSLAAVGAAAHKNAVFIQAERVRMLFKSRLRAVHKRLNDCI